ncbi:MAG TPA: lipoyl(octanoyl) transferase LipB, partial [Aggregicoccus sp.]|nr:lipoyl(octanoyl) transferase LipB [Aggregicoccus sp.]
VTYHGPGQVVGYPIFKLPPGRQDVRRYVRDVERCMIDTLAGYGLTAGTIVRWPGVWLGTEEDPRARKIAAIGVHIARWLTTHGFALNVNTHLDHFRLIVPCGIQDRGVTSLQRELGRSVDVGEVEEALAEQFCRVFEAERLQPPLPLRTVSVAVLRGEGPGTQVLLLRRTAERGGFWQTVTGRLEPGESAAQAAAREVHEELGRPLQVVDLGYRHAFALGDEVPPRLVEESAFLARWPQGAEPRLGPEHDAAEWVGLEEAAARLPFKGLRETVRRAALR